MLTYVPGETVVHRLDPRAKLGFQLGFAVAAFANPEPAWLGGVTLVALAALAAARLSPLVVLRSYRVIFAVLALGPLIAGFRPGPPWFLVDPALDSVLAIARVVPVLLVSAAYVHATPVRDTRAAIQWAIPGRFGQLLGVGVGMTVRFVPLVRADVRRVREAIAARGGDRRPLHDRVGRLGLLSARRALARADRLSVALQARCFAWNPTLPPLSVGPADAAVTAAGIGLAVVALLL